MRHLMRAISITMLVDPKFLVQNAAKDLCEDFRPDSTNAAGWYDEEYSLSDVEFRAKYERLNFMKQMNKTHE